MASWCEVLTSAVQGSLRKTRSGDYSGQHRPRPTARVNNRLDVTRRCLYIAKSILRYTLHTYTCVHIDMETKFDHSATLGKSNGYNT